jgi:hypothetical protein
MKRRAPRFRQILLLCLIPHPRLQREKQDYSNVIYMNGGEQLRSILIHIRRLSIARQSVSVEEMLMNKKLTLAAAGLCGSLLVLAPMSGALAAPVAPIGKAATENDFRSTAYYYGYHHRYHRYGYHHRHHRHCWWRYGHRHCRWW